MNTLSHHPPILPQKGSKVLFDDKELEWGFPEWQLEQILELWKDGKSVYDIARTVKRNPHEVFLALYEFWMDGEIDDVRRAFTSPTSLMVPGKEILAKEKEKKQKIVKWR